ncbi:MAG: VanW family protein [Oscillospiraceae bacterium]|jgi:vancomycin resistance protein YoaR|nr:VanW family protein [Oscillospiraceae bacterium]
METILAKNAPGAEELTAKAAAQPRSAAKRVLPWAIPLALLFLLLLTTAAFGVYVRSADVIYPNLSAAGVPLAGLTGEQAVAALLAVGFEDGGEDASASVTFPDGSALTLNGADVGLRRDAELAARAAFAYGRGDGFLADEWTYLMRLFGAAELPADAYIVMDDVTVRGEVRAFVAEWNARLAVRADVAFERGSITIAKWAEGVGAEEDAVFALMTETLAASLWAGAPLTADYPALTSGAPLTAEYALADVAVSDASLRALQESLRSAPVSAEYDPVTHTATRSAPGVELDIAVAKRLLDKAATGAYAEIPLILTEPELTTAALDAILFRDVLAERTTNIAGTSNRLTNIILASEAINGLVLNPGEAFSFNNVVGKRTTAKGYRTAGAYSGGQTIQTTGGGICQVSSTIYDCVLRTDLEVLTRKSHSMTVPYLPLGHDATVSWDYIDFEFLNSLEYPVRVEATVAERELTVRLYGTNTDGTRIELEDEYVSGRVVNVYKLRYDGDGELIERVFVARSAYSAGGH